MPPSKIIYLGVKGSAVAIDAGTGQQLWATHLKGIDFVNVVLDGESLYATTHGEIFCLNPATGVARWHNPLKGFGLGLVSIAAETGSSNPLPPLLAHKKRQDEQAAASA